MACALAAAALPVFSELAPDAPARFSETAAAAVESLGDTLIVRAMAESGLPRALRIANPWKLPRRVDGVRQIAP